MGRKALQWGRGEIEAGREADVHTHTHTSYTKEILGRRVGVEGIRK